MQPECAVSPLLVAPPPARRCVSGVPRSVYASQERRAPPFCPASRLASCSKQASSPSQLISPSPHNRHFARRFLLLARCGWHAGWFMRSVRCGPIVHAALAMPSQNDHQKHHAKTRTSAVVFVSGAYVLGAINTNSCPVGSVRITTEAQCRLAIAALSLVAASTMVDTSAEYPKGCYLYRSDSKVYFNPHPTGTAHSTSTPICGPAPSASTAQPGCLGAPVTALRSDAQRVQLPRASARRSHHSRPCRPAQPQVSLCCGRFPRRVAFRHGLGALCRRVRLRGIGEQQLPRGIGCHLYGSGMQGGRLGDRISL